MLPAALPKLARLWLLMGEWPELVYEETDAGVRAGVSSADEAEVTPCMLEPLLMAPELPRWFWKFGGLWLERY